MIPYVKMINSLTRGAERDGASIYMYIYKDICSYFIQGASAHSAEPVFFCLSVWVDVGLVVGGGVEK